jgi:hypothetical protein
VAHIVGSQSPSRSCTLDARGSRRTASRGRPVAPAGSRIHSVAVHDGGGLAVVPSVGDEAAQVRKFPGCTGTHDHTGSRS